MEKLINRKTDLRLAGISYKTGKSSNEELRVKDSYQIKKIESDYIDLIFERYVEMNFDRKEMLKVSVNVTRYAQEGVDLKKKLTEEIVKENVDYIFNTAFSFTSTLIAQITGAYGELPFVSAPIFYDEDEEKE